MGEVPDSTAPESPLAPTERLADGRVLARAAAKLNLSLRVGPVRADGFHPLDSMVAKITLYDDLVFAGRDDGAIVLTCDDPTIGPAEDNLVVRAAEMLRCHRGLDAGVDIELHKRIPAGAGLGGGSADAAVTLQVLNDLWSAGMGEAELAAMGAELGSDVPLSFGPPAMRMQGRGEILTPVALPPFAAVLVTPPIHCPTGEVYRAFDQTDPPPLQPIAPAAFRSRPISQWPDLLINDLLAPASEVCPGIGDWIARLAAATDEPVYMTGSGSALFILAAEREAAGAIFDRLPADLAAKARIVSLNPW